MHKYVAELVKLVHSVYSVPLPMQPCIVSFLLPQCPMQHILLAGVALD